MMYIQLISSSIIVLCYAALTGVCLYRLAKRKIQHGRARTGLK